MRVKSFAELERAEAVTAEELEATLRDYAITGAAIFPSVVQAIIERTPLSVDDLHRLDSAANKGLGVQTARKDHRTASEYRELHMYIMRRIAAMT